MAKMKDKRQIKSEVDIEELIREYWESLETHVRRSDFGRFSLEKGD